MVNGWMVMLEDDLPGGLNNPDGQHTPRYAVVTSWVARSVGVVAMLAFAFATAERCAGATGSRVA